MITIIGAGVSGLSAGIYLQMNGYETEIYEKHYIPGGSVRVGIRTDTILTVASTG